MNASRLFPLAGGRRPHWRVLAAAALFFAALAASTPAAAVNLTCSGWRLTFSDDLYSLITIEPPFSGAPYFMVNPVAVQPASVGTSQIDISWLDSNGWKWWFQTFYLNLPNDYTAYWGWAETPEKARDYNVSVEQGRCDPA